MKPKHQKSLPLSELETLQKLLNQRNEIALSFLFGSRARGDYHERSDWDIAILFNNNSDGWDNLGVQEEIRHQLSVVLTVHDDRIDLVDLYRGGLGINATVADEGIVITGKNSLDLANFYQRVWANLEDYYWNLEHVS